MEFCADVALSSVDFDNSSYLNSLPLLTCEIDTSKTRKNEESYQIKLMLKQKMNEELQMKENIKNDSPFI